MASFLYTQLEELNVQWAQGEERKSKAKQSGAVQGKAAQGKRAEFGSLAE